MDEKNLLELIDALGRTFERTKLTAEDKAKAEEAELRWTAERLGFRKRNDGLYENLVNKQLKLEKKALQELEQQYTKEKVLALRQQKLYEEQLQGLGYIINEQGKLERHTFELTKEQQRTLQQLQKQNDKLQQYNQSIVEPGKYARGLVDQMGGLNGVITSSKEKLYELNSGSLSATLALKAMEGAFVLAKGVFMGVVDGAMAMTKSIYNGERGQKVGAKGVTAFTKTVTEATHKFGDLLVAVGGTIIALGVIAAPFTGGLSLAAAASGAAAIALGTVIKAGSTLAEKFAELNEIAAEQNDKLFEGFTSLSKSAFTGAKGMTGVFENLQIMGMTVKEFENFRQILEANRKEMKMLGPTMNMGVDTFAQAAGDLFKSGLGRILETMGITADEQRAHTVKFMAYERRMGLEQSRTQEGLRKATFNYITELDKLAALTGTTRQEQEEARNAVLAIEELRAAIMEAEAQGDQQALERLRRFEQQATLFMGMGLRREATGLAQFAAAGGPTTLESAEVMRNLQGTIDRLETGEGTAAENFALGIRELKDVATAFAGVRKLGANLEGVIGGNFAAYADVFKMLGPMMAEIEKARKEGRQFNLDKFLEEQRTVQDKNTETNVQSRYTQQQLALDLDRIIKKFGEDTGINDKATKTFKEAVDKFKELIEKFGKTTEETPPITPAGTRLEKATGEAGVAYQSEQEARARLREAETGGDSAAIAAARQKVEEAKKEREEKEAAAAQAIRDRQEESLRERNQRRQQRRQGVGAPAGSIQISQADLASTHGLRFEPGDRQRENGILSPRLIELAKRVQAEIPGFDRFTSFNDNYDRGNTSAHTKGLALDFALARGITPSSEEGATIVKQLQDMGFSMALDEYNNPSSRATGPHFHAEIQQARMGGIFSGPNTGYPALLHGNEAVFNAPQLKSLLSMVRKSSIESGFSDVATGTGDFGMSLKDLVVMLSDKLDTFNENSRKSNGTLEEILTYTRA